MYDFSAILISDPQKVAEIASSRTLISKSIVQHTGDSAV